MTDLFKSFADDIKERLEKAKEEQYLGPKGKRGVRERRRVDVAVSKPKPIQDRLTDYKDSVAKGDLVKALMEQGFTQSARDLSIWDHKDNDANAMEKYLLKSNYGPKNMGLYNTSDNQKRKENNTGESLDNVGQNKNLKQYTTSNSSVQAASDKNTAKEQRKKTKESTKTMKDFSPEELQAMTDKANKPK